MGIKHIDKKSYSYLFIKHFVAFWHNHVFYRRIVIQNREKIPLNAHLIYTANHQNALMDAMVFLFSVKSHLVFMARSDIFNNPKIAAILYYFRMLPIFRIRDGYNEVKKNDKSFRKTIDVIKNKIGLVIMVEGNHGKEHRLRPLKKGFARIAFQTEEANDFKLNMHVVPIGIDYSNYENYRSELLIKFGKPIPVSDYYDAYKENPAIAINQIKEKLAESLISLMVHIKSEKYYDLYNELREIYKFEMAEKMGLPSARQPYKLQADQELIRQLEQFEAEHPEEMDAFQELILRYRDAIQKLGISYEVVKEKSCSGFCLMGKSLFYILAFPIFFPGWLFNYLPFGISIWAGGKMKDPQFKSSIKFGLSLFLWPLFYLIESLLVWFLFKDWGIVLFFMAAIPLLGILARAGWISFRLFLQTWRWTQLKKNNQPVYQSIKNDQQEIRSKTEAIIN